MVTVGFIVVIVYNVTVSAAKVVNFGSSSCRMEAVGCECYSDDNNNYTVASLYYIGICLIMFVFCVLFGMYLLRLIANMTPLFCD